MKFLIIFSLINSIAYANPYYYQENKACYRDIRDNNQLKPIFQIKNRNETIQLYKFNKVKNELVLTHDSPLSNEYQFSGLVSINKEDFSYYQVVRCF